MKRLFLSFIAGLLALSSYAQTDNTHFDLSVSLGRGNQISKGQYDTAVEKQFYDEMGRQTTFDLSFGYYFRPGSSLGLELLLDIGVGRASIAGTSGQLLNGQLTQGALGIVANYRWVINKSIIILGAGVASLVYMEDESLGSESYSMEAESWGIPFRLKYEYKLSKSIGLGISAAAYMGSASSITETKNGIITTTDLDSPSGIARWSITVGPRFHF